MSLPVRPTNGPASCWPGSGSRRSPARTPTGSRAGSSSEWRSPGRWQPRLLLLDEITSALDPELVGEVLAIVRELAAGGMTILMATHEMGFAKQVADTVCFLDGGRVLESGPPGQVLGDPVHERTRRFLAHLVDAGRLS